MGEGGPESLSLAIGLTAFAPDCRLLFTFITHKLQEHLVGTFTVSQNVFIVVSQVCYEFREYSSNHISKVFKASNEGAVYIFVLIF